MTDDVKNRFSIWGLNQLHNNFILEINRLNINKYFKKFILDAEHTKITVCKYNLNSSYHIKLYLDNNKNILMIRHLWNNLIFSVDVFDINNKNVIYLSSIESMLADIFETIVDSLMYEQFKFTDDIQRTIMNIFDKARFNYEQFKYLMNHCSDKKFVEKVKARIILYTLNNVEFKNKSYITSYY